MNHLALSFVWCWLQALVVAGLALEMPTGDFKLISSGALFDIGVLDPMLQPGSGSWDFVGNLQASHRLTPGGLDLT